MKMLRTMSIGVVALALSACAASGPMFTEVAELSDETSGVYVYRMPRFVGSGGWPPVYVDGELVGDLQHGGYLYVELTPGLHQVQVGVEGGTAWWVAPVMQHEFHAFPGKSNYFEVTVQASGITFRDSKTMLATQHVTGDFAASGVIVPMSANIGLLAVDEDAALEDLKDTRLSQ